MLKEKFSKLSYLEKIGFPAIKPCAFVFAMACMASVSVASDEVSAPKGWDEVLVSQTRVITKGTSIIEIGPWRDLKGQSLPDYLAAHEQSVPAGAVFLSSKGVKADSESDSFYVTQEIKLNSKAGQSQLHLCPGLPGFARMMSFAVETRLTKLADLIAAGLFVVSVCENESKGGEGPL